MKHLAIIMLLIIHSNLFSTPKDSIYLDLKRFMDKMESSNFDVIDQNSYKHDSIIRDLYIYDILDKSENNTKINFRRSVGVYLFKYIGSQNDYILIVERNSYTVFKSRDINNIFDRLSDIHEANPKALNDRLFLKYIKILVKKNLVESRLCVKIGALNYIFNSTDDYSW